MDKFWERSGHTTYESVKWGWWISFDSKIRRVHQKIGTLFHNKTKRKTNFYLELTIVGEPQPQTSSTPHSDQPARLHYHQCQYYLQFF